MMNKDLVRLDRFNGSKITSWQDKFKFLLITLKIFCVFDLNLTLIPEAAAIIME